MECSISKREKKEFKFKCLRTLYESKWRTLSSFQDGESTAWKNGTHITQSNLLGKMTSFSLYKGFTRGKHYFHSRDTGIDVSECVCVFVRGEG